MYPYAYSKALEFDAYNTRALYRRAMGFHKLGTTAGLEDAVKDLQTARSLEPDNIQVGNTLGNKGELLNSRRLVATRP